MQALCWAWLSRLCASMLRMVELSPFSVAELSMLRLGVFVPCFSPLWIACSDPSTLPALRSPSLILQAYTGQASAGTCASCWWVRPLTGKSEREITGHCFWSLVEKNKNPCLQWVDRCKTATQQSCIRFGRQQNTYDPQLFTGFISCRLLFAHPPHPFACATCVPTAQP